MPLFAVQYDLRWHIVNTIGQAAQEIKLLLPLLYFLWCSLIYQQYHFISTFLQETCLHTVNERWGDELASCLFCGQLDVSKKLTSGTWEYTSCPENRTTETYRLWNWEKTLCTSTIILQVLVVYLWFQTGFLMLSGMVVRQCARVTTPLMITDLAVPFAIISWISHRHTTYLWPPAGFPFDFVCQKLAVKITSGNHMTPGCCNMIIWVTII